MKMARALARFSVGRTLLTRLALVASPQSAFTFTYLVVYYTNARIGCGQLCTTNLPSCQFAVGGEVLSARMCS
jgi:hypothetical protein